VEVAADATSGSTLQASVLKAVCTDIADYALLVPSAAAPCQNLYRDSKPLAPPYVPSPPDLGGTVFVLSPRGVRATTFRGLYGHLPAGNAGMMRGLIVTNYVTQPGDSGACLVDTSSRVWGLLVGYSIVQGQPYSVFMSAELLLALEKSAFL
jgi:hypothetical protein